MLVKSHQFIFIISLLTFIVLFYFFKKTNKKINDNKIYNNKELKQKLQQNLKEETKKENKKKK